MTAQSFTPLEPDSIRSTRDALHAYSLVLGKCLKAHRPKRKHWWHASLRPALRGLTTGIVRADVDYEIELDLEQSQLNGKTACGQSLSIALNGQPADDIQTALYDFLSKHGVRVDDDKTAEQNNAAFPGYAVDTCGQLGQALRSVSAAMESFRAGIREETSPIQIWPHHFDLSMLWLPGAKVAGQDVDNEEYADRQMNFGFVFGDDTIAEPYCYVTAYPLPDALPKIELPDPAAWHGDGFNGVVLPYQHLVSHANADGYLLNLWNRVLDAGRQHMSVDT